MKNVLYIGPYADTNGLGYASRRYLDALIHNSDINLSIRPIFITSSSVKNPIDLSQYKYFVENSYTSYDYVIQHGFPEMFVYDSRLGKNIGIVEIETRKIHRSGWINRLNLMDEIYVNSINGINTLSACGVNTSVKLVPDTFNIQDYTQQLDPFFNDLPPDKPFIFYTIGNYSEKNNIKGIILAYLLEFSNKDNVKLVIKTNNYDLELQDLDNQIKLDIKLLKDAVRKKYYPDINIISGYISDIDKIRLHQCGDCYVNAVRADGGGSSAIEAILSNSIVINTKNIGSSTYFNSGNAIMVDSIPSNVYSPQYMNPNILTIHEEWNEPNILHLKSQMRKAYSMQSEEKNSLLSKHNKEIFDHNHFNMTFI